MTLRERFAPTAPRSIARDADAARADVIGALDWLPQAGWIERFDAAGIDGGIAAASPSPAVPRPT